MILIPVLVNEHVRMWVWLPMFGRNLLSPSCILKMEIFRSTETLVIQFSSTRYHHTKQW